jgi:pimeloyl-ACP methyl ester carboxylesterase
MRGYGQTDRPEAIDAYTLLHLVGDMVGVLDALGSETAVIVGHDWGAPVAWNASLLRPDRFRAVIGLSVPFRPRGKMQPTKVMPRTEQAVFYQLYFQTPGMAEADLEADVHASTLAERGRSGFLCRRIFAQRFPQRIKLVSQYRP